MSRKGDVEGVERREVPVGNYKRVPETKGELPQNDDDDDRNDSKTKTNIFHVVL